MSRADAHEPVGSGETRLGERSGPVVTHPHVGGGHRAGNQVTWGGPDPLLPAHMGTQKLCLAQCTRGTRALSLLASGPGSCCPVLRH